MYKKHRKQKPESCKEEKGKPMLLFKCAVRDSKK